MNKLYIIKRGWSLLFEFGFMRISSNLECGRVKKRKVWRRYFQFSNAWPVKYSKSWTINIHDLTTPSANLALKITRTLCVESNVFNLNTSTIFLTK